MNGITLHVSNVSVANTQETTTMSFLVTMDIDSLIPSSDLDGELFNQYFGAEVLAQVVQQLRKLE